MEEGSLVPNSFSCFKVYTPAGTEFDGFGSTWHGSRIQCQCTYPCSYVPLWMHGHFLYGHWTGYVHSR